MEQPLEIARGLTLPLDEVLLRASRSSGPGGQHANVTASRVEAVFDVAAFLVIAALLRSRKPRVPDTPASVSDGEPVAAAAVGD